MPPARPYRIGCARACPGRSQRTGLRSAATGQYADARRLIDEIVRTEPRADLRNVRDVFGSNPNTLGGSSDREGTRIGPIVLKVGGKEVALAERTVFSRAVGDARFHGLPGIDVLSQADEVTIDFRAMTLTLR